MRCLNPSKPDYEYCCAAHDPSKPYINPRMFDVFARAATKDQIVAQYGGQDLYHNEALDLATRGRVEKDHIVELQCFAYVARLLDLSDDEDLEFIADIIREIANSLKNLCLTRKTTNRIKGASVFKFLDDCVTGHRDNNNTFNSYMVAESDNRRDFGRDTTRVITHEMGLALKRCQRLLADQGETPLLEALAAELQELYVLMELRARRH